MDSVCCSVDSTRDAPAIRHHPTDSKPTKGGAVKIAIIGTGNMGGGLGRQFAAGGHKVVVGSRDPARAAALAEEIGGAGHGTYGEAAAQADALLLAVNWWNVDETLPQLGDVDGKILIDCTNPYTDDTYSTFADLGGTSAAEVIQQRLPGARVVKGWNHVFASIVNSSPDFDGVAASVLLAGDDEEAKAAVSELARDAGYDPVDAGPLWSASNIEKVAALMVTLAYVVGGGTDQALKIVHR